MRRNTKIAISDEWSNSSFAMQQDLIMRFIEMHGRIEYNRSEWFYYLATEFGIFDFDFPITHKTDSVVMITRRTIQ